RRRVPELADPAAGDRRRVGCRSSGRSDRGRGVAQDHTVSWPSERRAKNTEKVTRRPGPSAGSTWGMRVGGKKTTSPARGTIATKVSTLVNNVRNNGPESTEPV